MLNAPMNSQTIKSTNPKLSIWVLIAIASIGTLALNIFVPSMPSLVTSLSTTQSMAQLTLTFYLLSLAFAQLIVGPLSDKYGRRPILLLGILIYVIASLASAFAINIETLISARIFQALGGCCGIVITRAIIRDVYSKSKGVVILSYLTAAITLAPMLAPILGAFLDQWASWRASFYFVAAFGVLIGLIALKGLYETNFNLTKSMNFSTIPAQYWSLLKEPEFLGYALAVAFNNSVFFSFIAGAPFIIADVMHLGPSTYAFYFLLVSGGYMAGNFLAGRFANKIKTQKMINIGIIIMLVGIMAALYGYSIGYSHPIILFGPMGFIALSAGLISPNAIAGLLNVRPDIAGTAAGLSGFLQMLSGALGTFMVGTFHQQSGFSMVGFMTFFAILMVISFYGLVGRKSNKAENA
ncbi:MAG: multidrug transporter [Hyphomicrobiales bacterium]|nr:MAG: multidrug transporter [Hyphomicrobiales bacterium]